MKQRTSLSRCLISLAAFVPLVAGCDDPVLQPFAPNALYFSIFGVLNASADTQWLRVTPVRRTVNTTAATDDIAVTLEHLGTGALIPMRDSLFQFEDVVGAGTFRRNYWTTEPIEAGASYRLTATDESGRSARATVPVAANFQTVVVGIRNHVPTEGYVRVDEANHLALVHVRHTFIPPCDYALSQFAVPQLVLGGDVKQVRVITTVEEEFLPCPVDADKTIFIAASGSEWPASPEFAASALDLPDLPTNVENGVGFVGGIVTRTIPWETCFYGPFTGTDRFCELTYGPNAATMHGTVSDGSCGTALDDAIVELTEIIGGSVQNRRIRQAITKDDGSYALGALDPDRAYIRRISHPDEWFAAGPIYQPQVDTTSFLPSEERMSDFVLERRTNADGVPLGRVCGA